MKSLTYLRELIKAPDAGHLPAWLLQGEVWELGSGAVWVAAVTPPFLKS